MSALGSKTVLTPLKWDFCFTPESRHRSATLPIAISSSATVSQRELQWDDLPDEAIDALNRLQAACNEALDAAPLLTNAAVQ